MDRTDFDALLVVSFGGPEKRADVMPFLENVVRGKPVPKQRLLQVAEHYYRLGGRSPINDQNRALIRALRTELRSRGPRLPIYWGNRNWHPLLPDVLRSMASDGVRHALAFATSAFSSYSGCRQYRENIEHAVRSLDGVSLTVEKIRPFFNHPGFIAASAARVASALGRLDDNARSGVRVLYTAHSIPTAMAEGCQYVAQLREAARLVSERVGAADWEVVFQSRSGPPSQPWLEPDVCDRLKALPDEGATGACVAPIGFLSDHVEVIHDLDTEAAAVADGAGLPFVRAATVGTHPRFVAAVRDLVAERVGATAEPAAVGTLPACPDTCPQDCCLPPPRRGAEGSDAL